MRFGSVCSGIEAASVAWGPIGWQAAWFSEIEPFPCAVLAHHYSDVPNLGDMTTLPDRIRGGEVEAPDVFCGGTPCQAFSVAGLRRSLDDARGNLSLTFCEIADAIDHVRLAGGEPASIVFWENVPGVLSTRDNAFGCFLARLCGGDEPLHAPDGWPDAGCVSGPTRTAAWRVLDAQYFGLAQRRRRVFVVASARDGFDPAAVLLEFEGVRRDSAPSREAREAVTPTIDASFGRLQGCSGQDANHGHGHLISMCLNAKGGAGRLDAESETLIPTNGGVFDVAHSLRGEGFDASEDGTGRGTPLVPVAFAETAPTLSVGAHGAAGHPHRQHGNETAIVGMTAWRCPDCGHAQQYNHRGCRLFTAHAFDARQSDVIQYGDKTGPLDTDGHTIGVMQPVGVFQDSEFGVQQYDSAGTLRAGRIPEHQMVMQPVAVPVPMINMQGSKGNAVAQADGPSFTLNAMHGHDMHAVAVPVAFHPTQDPISSAGVCHAIGANANATAAVACMDVAGTLKSCANSGGWTNSADHAAAGYMQPVGMQVRRLTPVECERLQGFPDGYTAIPWRGKPASECPDGPRYKALGNSWAVPVVRWIGRRIQSN